ncbi:uncharacterized protein LOC130053568 [Ostrea edulis]|uniref:uncharacterized protein LOC130053568 n=1 Tax=Ostrea edulis TaxID=37623 RepID=UPI0024AF1718|nr:uncharacterized protein LOC130053568 [Ostrea edulis]
MPKFYCVAEGCTSDTKKKGRYGFMADVKFFPFPTPKQPKLRRKWLELLWRRDFNPSRHDRLYSRHFVDGEPTAHHPYPELFRYNNYKCLQGTQGTSSIEKRLVNQQNLSTDADDIGDDTSNTTSPLQDDEGVTLFPLPVESEIILQSIPSVEQMAMPHDHEYCTASVQVHSQTSDVQCQTDLTLQDLEDSEAELKHLRETFKDKEDLRRYLSVAKMTESDSSVKSYFGLPSVLTLFGIFAILDKTTPTLMYWKGGSGAKNARATNPYKKS